MDNSKIIEEFRSNHGIVGGWFEGMKLLIMTTKGAKSGKESLIPVAYSMYDENYVVVASKAGAPTNPSWYYNLLANPEITIEVGDEKIKVHAVNTNGKEREKLFNHHAKQYPTFNDYKAKTTRVIPVLILKQI